MMNIQETDQLIEIAKAKMIEHAPQYTFEDKTAFLYLGRVKGEGTFVVGLLKTDPKVIPCALADVTFDTNPLTAVSTGLSYLGTLNPSFKIFEYLSPFQVPALENVESMGESIGCGGLEGVLRTCIERQNQVNAYARGLAYLNEQVRGGKSK